MTMDGCCASPKREWSGTYGTSPRRVYWLCVACRQFGVLLFPRDSEYTGDIAYRDVSQPTLDEIYADKPITLEFLVRAGESWMSHRNKMREVTAARLGIAVVDEAIRVMKSDLKQQSETIIRRLREQVVEETARLHRLQDVVRKKIKKAPKLTPIRVRRPVTSDFPVLVHADQANAIRPVIYGLVDPATPEAIRYVGQTVSPYGRYLQHVSEIARPVGVSQRVNRKAAWIAELREHGRYPHMVLLKHLRSGADMNGAEKRWIGTLRAIGQADLNTALVVDGSVVLMDGD